MAKNLSDVAVQSANATETDQVWLVLIEIDHPTLTSPLRGVNNTTNITSGGDTYSAYPFNIVFGTDDGEKLPSVQLTFDNVDRVLVNMIRSIGDSPDVTIKVILASNPDIIEIEISELKLREIQYDAYTITGTLYADDILNQRWPKDQITTAAGYLGLFR